jgi:methanethiol oxidase
MLRAGMPSSSSHVEKLDADLDSGGISPDLRFFPNGEDFRGLRVHQTRLQAGDASSDSYCFTS